VEIGGQCWASVNMNIKTIPPQPFNSSNDNDQGNSEYMFDQAGTPSNIGSY